MNPLSKKLKIFAILQLCIVLSYGLWCAAWPFMGEIFAVRSKLLLFEVVMGKGEFASRYTTQPQLHTNQKRFLELPELTKKRITEGFQKLSGKLNRPIYIKMTDALSLFIFDLPVFLQIWFIAGFFIPLWLLLGKAKAYHAVWLLPIIACCYAVDNRLNAIPAKLPADIGLFPSETYLVDHYLNEPLDSSVLKQQAQLAAAWDNYLIQEWVNAKNEVISQEVLKEMGAYQFLAARVDKLAYRPLDSFQSQFKSQESLGMLFIFLLWNFFLAFSTFQEKPKELIYPEVTYIC